MRINKPLHKLLKKPYFTSKEAKSHGMSVASLSYPIMQKLALSSGYHAGFIEIQNWKVRHRLNGRIYLKRQTVFPVEQYV